MTRVEHSPEENQTLHQARDAGRIFLNEVESKQVLRDAGIETTQATLATSRDQAVEQASAIGYPVVLKVISPDVVHKSDVGGVKLGLKDAAETAAAYDDIVASINANQPGAVIEGVSVQGMARPGTEVIIGMSKDSQFGPVLMFGLGGIMVEVLKDVAFRIVPLESRDARQVVREIRGFPVLEGVRGQPGADLDALEAMILQVSAFAEEHPEVAELDLNPVFAYPDGAIAVDARVVLAEE
jgi:acyl-CoA synthetase (NDP forming)